MGTSDVQLRHEAENVEPASYSYSITFLYRSDSLPIFAYVSRILFEVFINSNKKGYAAVFDKSVIDSTVDFYPKRYIENKLTLSLFTRISFRCDNNVR